MDAGYEARKLLCVTFTNQSVRNCMINTKRYRKLKVESEEP